MTKTESVLANSQRGTMKHSTSKSLILQNGSLAGKGSTEKGSILIPPGTEISTSFQGTNRKDFVDQPHDRDESQAVKSRSKSQHPPSSVIETDYMGSEDTRQMKQSPSPRAKGNNMRGLTKSLLEQHEAFEEIDPTDED